MVTGGGRKLPDRGGAGDAIPRRGTGADGGGGSMGGSEVSLIVRNSSTGNYGTASRDQTHTRRLNPIARALLRIYDILYVAPPTDPRLRAQYRIFVDFIYQQVIVAATTGAIAATFPSDENTAITTLNNGITHFDELPFLARTVLEKFFTGYNIIQSDLFFRSIQIEIYAFLALNVAGNAGAIARAAVLPGEVPGRKLFIAQRLLHAGGAIASGITVPEIIRSLWNLGRDFVQRTSEFAVAASQEMINGTTCAQLITDGEFEPVTYINGSCSGIEIIDQTADHGWNIARNVGIPDLVIISFLVITTLCLILKSCCSREHKTMLNDDLDPDRGNDRPSTGAPSV